MRYTLGVRAQPVPTGGRFLELDSLRGLAALSVVFHHFLIALPAFWAPVQYPQPTPLWPLVFTPLHAVWAGREAVIFFFVLSGFVLSLPFYERPVGYRAFVIKRICRIWIPYATAVVAAIVLSWLLARHRIGGLSGWFNGIWTTSLTPGLVLGHFTLIGSFPNVVLDPVLWSLVHEMRISLVFPILMFFVIRWNWLRAIVVAATLSVLGSILPSDHQDYAASLEFVLMFMVGALLARHRHAVSGWYRSLPRAARRAIPLLAVLAYTYAWWVLPMNSRLHLGFMNDWATGLGASLLVIMAISSDAVAGALRRPALVLVGRASYSIYLLHAIAFLSLVYLLFPALPLWLIWPIALAATLGAALLVYRTVEVPAINLGHALAAQVKSGRPSLRLREDRAA